MKHAGAMRQAFGHRRGADGLQQLPPEGGAALWVVDDRGGDPAPTRLRGVLSFWSPDGRTIVYSRDRDFGDIHVIEPPR